MISETRQCKNTLCRKFLYQGKGFYHRIYCDKICKEESRKFMPKRDSILIVERNKPETPIDIVKKKKCYWCPNELDIHIRNYGQRRYCSNECKKQSLKMKHKQYEVFSWLKKSYNYNRNTLASQIVPDVS